MEFFVTIIKWLLVIYAFYIIGKSAFTESSLTFTKKVVSNFNLIMFVKVVLTMSFTIMTFSWIYQTLPILQWGWSEAIFGKSINIAFAPTNTGNKTFDMLLGIPFVILFAIAVPKLAYVEEKLFRNNTISILPIIFKSLLFGLIHCIVGIPLAAGLCLSFAGLLFAFAYKAKYYSVLKTYGNAITIDGTITINLNVLKESGIDFDLKDVINRIQNAPEEALLYSTSYHVMWNWLISILMLIVIFTL